MAFKNNLKVDTSLKSLGIQSTMKSQKISIIIPCKQIDEYAKECIDHCKQLLYDNLEIILLPDYSKELIEGVMIIATGTVTPGKKRNVGVENSTGEICAFIDSDAYPKNDWLTKSLQFLDDPEIVAIGGPGLTPNTDNMMQKASGLILSSLMIGSISRRYNKSKSVISDDIHSCNFIARKKIIKEVGGWNEKYWPGEDTLICLNIIKQGGKMVESSEVVVYHHRRPLFIPYIRQLFQFGLHRGFFAKKFRDNSLKLIYFIPSILVLSFLTGIILSVFSPIFFTITLSAVLIYSVLSLISSLFTTRNTKLLFLSWIGIIITHFTYGISFLIGFIRNDLDK